MDELADSIAGQQPAPLPDVAQPQDLTPPLAADPTEDTQMDTGAMETDQNQGDIVMGDGSGAQANDSETGKTE